MNPIVFVDADSILFKIAATETTKYRMRVRYGKTISDIGKTTFSDEVLVCVKGTGSNFRYSLFPDYKGKRPELDTKLKENLNYLHGYAVDQGAIMARDGWEADDEVGEWTREAYAEGLNYIIAHIDKDLDMLPGQHYNYNKDRFYDVSLNDALYNFYRQLLVGDNSDNIPGVRGIGPVKAEAILDSSTVENVHDVVAAKWGDSAAMELSARLLFMGDPDLFTWDLRKLYAKENQEKVPPCRAHELESVRELESEDESVVHRDDIEEESESEEVLREQQGCDGMAGSEEGSTS